MRSPRPLLPLPWQALPSLLLGLSLLAGGCTSTRYSVEGAYAPEQGLANESTMAAPLKESYPSAMQLGRVLLVRTDSIVLGRAFGIRTMGHPS